MSTMLSALSSTYIAWYVGKGSQILTSRSRGPDTKYSGRDICYGYNEDTLTM